MATYQDIQTGIDEAKKTLAGITAQAQPLIYGGSNTPISSSVITPQADLSKLVTQPQSTPVTAPTYEPTPLTLTAPEQQASDLTKKLQSLYDSSVGESSYRAEQEKVAGIPELSKTQRDLESQLKQLSNEALAIPQQLQLDATGRGITAGGLAPIQTGRLRENAIKALTVNSLLEASRGNLATARDLVERNVRAKFDPIDEEISAKLKNLDLIRNSPQYTLEEKNRAEAQAEIQQQKLNQSQEDRQATSDILNLANEAIQNGITNTLTLQKIQNAKDSSGRPSLAVAQQILAQAFESQPALQPTQNLTYKELPDGRAVMLDTQGNIVKTVYSPSSPTGVVSGGGVMGEAGEMGQPPIATINGKPLTDTQATSLGYAQRLNDANSIITELGGKFTGALSYVSGSSFFPNILKSDDRQRYEQAQRNFINSILRKESGAAISPSEFDSAAKQYFPQPGDSQAVIDQKTANRLRAISNLTQSANVPLSTVTGTQQSSGSYADYLKAIGQ